MLKYLQHHKSGNKADAFCHAHHSNQPEVLAVGNNAILKSINIGKEDLQLPSLETM